MSEAESVARQTVSKRDVKSLNEAMVVREVEPGIYAVTGASGSEYRVEPELRACTCPDCEYRDVTCKHIRRVRYEAGLDELPMPPQDPLFRAFVDGEAVC